MINFDGKAEFGAVMKWLLLLRDGSMKKGVSQLYDKSDDTFCCLGVALISHKMKKEEIDGELYMSLRHRAMFGISNENEENIAMINDVTFRKDVDFKNVFNELVTNPDTYFVEEVAQKIKEEHERGTI